MLHYILQTYIFNITKTQQKNAENMLIQLQNQLQGQIIQTFLILIKH